MKRGGQGGFTIIETLLFLGISSLLVLVIVVGRGAATRRAQFSDSLESLHSRLTQLQREQFSTSNPTSPTLSGSIQNADTIQFMTVVQFQNNSAEVRVEKCVTDREDGPEGLGAYDDFTCDPNSEFTYEIKWGAKYSCQGSNPASTCADTVLFVRHHSTGDLKTIGLNTEDGQTISNALKAEYNSTTPRMKEIGVSSADDSITGGIIINDSGNLSDLGTGNGRINQIGRVFR